MTHGHVGGAILAGVLVAFAALGAADPPPPNADLRPAFTRYGLSPKSQGGRGCCSLFALCGVLEFEFALSGRTPVRLSEEYLNWASHQSNGRTTDGSFFSDGLRGLRLLGICTEALMPYRDDYDPGARPSDDARQEAATRTDVAAVWIKGWDVTTGMTPEMLARLKAEIAGGHPVAIGMRWPKREQYEGAVLTVPIPEDVFDGHSVVLVGYRDDPSQPGGGAFNFRNSSGPAWRESGHAYLPYAYVAAYGNDAVAMRIGGGETVTVNAPGPGALEFEALPVITRRECATLVQEMGSFGAALWSGGRQLFVGSGEGALVRFSVSVPAEGRYRLSLWATRAPDFGIISVGLDGEPVGEPVDLYAPGVLPTGEIVLGAVALGAGARALDVRVVGRDAASSAYRAGLDCVRLEAQ